MPEWSNGLRSKRNGLVPTQVRTLSPAFLKMTREKPTNQATLCLVLKEDQILLGLKKEGPGSGKYNGYGGKVEPGETIEQAALRELKEESELESTPEDLNKVGEIDFYFPHKPEWNQTVHTFIVKSFKGEPKETKEMGVGWFNLNEVPYGKMWDGDKHWMPLILSGKKVKATIVFKDVDGENIVDQKEINYEN